MSVGGRPVDRSFESLPSVGTRSVTARLRRSPIPNQEPHPASRVRTRDLRAGPPPTQGTLALTLPQDLPAPESADAADGLDPQSTDPTNVGLLPEPRAWATTFIQAAMEVAGGLRPANQLVRWTTPEVQSLLVRRGALASRTQRTSSSPGAKPRLRALLTCIPQLGVCEVSAVIMGPDRIRAVAFRMEGLHGRWRVTALEIG
jgi:hypothetical protein